MDEVKAVPVSEVPGMQDIVERLKKEREAIQGKYYKMGAQDGLQWAKAAHYEELFYVGGADEDTIQEIVENPLSDDMILKDYFQGVLEENKAFEIQNWRGGSDPNEPFSAWLDGWTDAVIKFWEDVSKKL